MKKIKKINNRSRLKTSTALTSFLGVFVVYSSIHGAYAATTTTGVLNTTASVVAACTVTAANITLGAFVASDISGSGDVSLNCTYGTGAIVSLDTASDAAGGKYNLYHTSGATTAADIIEVGLYKDVAAGYTTVLTSATPSWTATGTGAAVSIGTIGAKIDASGQTAKRNGTFSKSFTLLVTY